jgi:hypothetical protein
MGWMIATVEARCRCSRWSRWWYRRTTTNDAPVASGFWVLCCAGSKVPHLHRLTWFIPRPIKTPSNADVEPPGGSTLNHSIHLLHNQFNLLDFIQTPPSVALKICLCLSGHPIIVSNINTDNDHLAPATSRYLCIACNTPQSLALRFDLSRRSLTPRLRFD